MYTAHVFPERDSPHLRLSSWIPSAPNYPTMSGYYERGGNKFECSKNEESLGTYSRGQEVRLN